MRVISILAQVGEIDARSMFRYSGFSGFIPHSPMVRDPQHETCRLIRSLPVTVTYRNRRGLAGLAGLADLPGLPGLPSLPGLPGLAGRLPGLMVA